MKPRAHLWPQFQPEPAAAPGSWKTVDGSKIEGQGWRNVGSLATLTRTTYQQPAVERRKERKTVELQCGNARSCRSGKSRAGHRSQPSTNPHHLPGFKSINSSLPFGSVLDLAGRGVPANQCQDIVHHLLFTSSMLSHKRVTKTKMSEHRLEFDMLIRSVLTVSVMKKVDNRSKEVPPMGKTCEHISTTYMLLCCSTSNNACS